MGLRLNTLLRLCFWWVESHLVCRNERESELQDIFGCVPLLYLSTLFSVRIKKGWNFQIRERRKIEGRTIWQLSTRSPSLQVSPLNIRYSIFYAGEVFLIWDEKNRELPMLFNFFGT